MGFNKYIELLYQDRENFDQLMKINIDFAVEWANLQFEAGATVVVYFDPLGSPNMIPTSLFLETGYEIAKQTLSQFSGPNCYHFASSDGEKVIPYLKDLPINLYGISEKDNIDNIRSTIAPNASIIGNFSGIKLVHQTETEIINTLENIIQVAGHEGGFILSDNHGEIPYYVSDSQLSLISEFMHKKTA